MKMQRSLAFGMVAVLFGTFVLALATSVEAQANRELIISPRGTPQITGLVNNRLAPETALATVNFGWTMTIQGPSQCVGVPMKATYALLESPAYAPASVSTAFETRTYVGGGDNNPASGVAGTEPESYDDLILAIAVAVTRDAPAFEPIRIVVQATPTAGKGSQQDQCSIINGPAVTQEVFLIPDYLPSISYIPDSTILKTGQNKQIAFPIRMINFGNFPSRVSTELVGGTGGLAVNTPPEIFIDSKVTGGATAKNEERVNIGIITAGKNGYTNKVYSFQVKFIGKADSTGTNLQTQPVGPMSFTVKVQGVYVPGFDASSVLSALGIGLLGLGFMRRRL